MAKYRILVVDDETDVRAIITAALRPFYEVVEAHDGLDALEKLDRIEPDFVLMDVMMPLMDGFQACDAIRKNSKYSNLPVMFLSALGTKDDIRKGYAAGATLFLTKPFEPPRLLRNIQLYFESNPPRATPKRYSLPELEAMAKAPSAPRSHIHDAETAHDFLQMPPPPPRMTSAFPAPPPRETPLPAPSFPPVPPAPQPPPKYQPPPSYQPPQSYQPPKAQMPLGAAFDLPPLESMEGESAGGQPENDSEPPAADLGVAPIPRIMVVDDDLEIISVFRMMLSDRCEITYATDGLQAIDRIVRHQPDLIVVDIMLPKMSGFQLCQSLRQNQTFSKTPILICSAKSTPRDLAYAKRVGANDYLVKPFSQTDLLTRIEGMLSVPGFRIHPKNLTMKEIWEEIKPVTEDDVFDSKIEERNPEFQAAPAASEEVLKRFLKNEGGKEAFERQLEDKKKSWFFGFGKEK